MPLCPIDTTETEDLRLRISELEEENANLRLLDEVVRRNTAVFEALLANNSGGIALVGPHRRIVRVVRGLDGFSRGDLTGARIESLVPFEDHAALLDGYERILQRRCDRAEFEIRLYRPDGSFRWVAVTLTDMLDDPNVQAIVCNVDDITERRNGEIVLAELAVLAEITEWAVFSLDTHGNVLTWNAAAERAFGYSAAEIVGQSVAALMPDEREYAERGKASQTGSFRSTWVRRDGEMVPVAVRVSPVLDKNGHTRARSHFVKVLRVLSAGAGYPCPIEPRAEGDAEPAD